MREETKARNARVRIYGIKKRCRKSSNESVEVSAQDDKTALQLLKEKVKEHLKGYRVVEGFSTANCQDITFIDCGSYKIKQMNIYCDSLVSYEFSV